MGKFGTHNFQENQQRDAEVRALLANLKACSKIRNLQRGKQLHAQAVERGLTSHIYVQSALVNMYAKCGSMLQSRQVFDHMERLDVVSWNALILGYAENRQGPDALASFTRMRTEACPPDALTFVAALKACACLSADERFGDCSKAIHKLAVDSGCSSNAYVRSALIDMYSKGGCMVNAGQVFRTMKRPDVVSWTALILGYAESGEGTAALDLFEEMINEGPAPTPLTFVAALKACIAVAVTEGHSKWAECRIRGKVIHKLAVDTGCSSNSFVQSTLIDMYGKCGGMSDARQVFDTLEDPDAVCWNALMQGYTENGEGRIALDLFKRMGTEGPPPTPVTFVAALKACIALSVTEGAGRWADCRDLGIGIHRHAVETGFISNIYVRSTLIDLYCKCGRLVEARQVFDSMKRPDVVSWTALILGYAENGEGVAALKLFARMTAEGLAPDSVTFVAVLKACSSLTGGRDECRTRVKALHNLAVEKGCGWNLYVQGTLIDMYSKCGNMEDARQVFDSLKHADAICWTALILGYAESGHGATALELFTRMESEGPAPISLTFVAALKGCTRLKEASGWQECRNSGRAIHKLTAENGCSNDSYVQSALIDMYSKSGSLVEARQVFESMKHADVASWNALIWGYAENGQGPAALDLFTRMRSQGPKPDSVTFAAALKACALLGALEIGREIHSTVDQGSKVSLLLVNCLVDFYARCGSLVEAQSVFDSHDGRRDLVTWNSLMSGYSSCGDTESVFRLFEGMQEAGYKPDGFTFLCVLTCCSHAGLVEKAKEFFDLMRTKFGVVPTVEHYNCMVDVFGRTMQD